MSTGILFMDQFSALLSSVPPVGYSLTSELSGQRFHSTLQGVLMSGEQVPDHVGASLGESIAVDDGLAASFGEPLVSVDDTLESVDVGLMVLDPGHSVPVSVEELARGNTDVVVAQVGVVGTDDKAVLDLDAASLRESTRVSVAGHGDRLPIAEASEGSQPQVSQQNVRLPPEQLRSPVYFQPQSDGALSAAASAGDVLLLDGESKVDSERSSIVGDSSSRGDVSNSDQAVHSSRVDLSRGVTQPLINLHRTSSDIHPLVMAPPAANTLKQTIQFMVNDQVPEAEIQLDPPELGSILVKLKIENGQQAQIVFQSPHPSVRDLLADHVERLRESLADMGFDLGGVDVQVGSQGRDSEDQPLSHVSAGWDEADEESLGLASQEDAEQGFQSESDPAIHLHHFINERV